MKIIELAQNEWQKYLSKAGIKNVDFSAETDDGFADKKFFSRFGYDYDSEFDDAFMVTAEKGRIKIKATNERSVLLAVYDALRRLGFLFLRPGDSGERIPLLRENDIRLNYTHHAKYRIRGIAPCAPKEIESMKKYIEWLPKLGLNTYFMEGFSSDSGYRSWYKHEENSMIPPDESYNLDKGLEYDCELWNIAKSRGLLYSAMGHGWNVAVISNNIFNDFYPLPDTKIENRFVALVDGKRDLPRGIVRCANLCLSNPTVQRKLLCIVEEYVKKNPQVDILQVWLGDSLNHACECDDCRKMRLSDWYVSILNKIDELLTRLGSKMKIVFAVYGDTMWPPIRNKLNGNRFTLLFCPICRDYSKSYDTVNYEAVSADIPDYDYNNLKVPSDLSKLLGHLKAWQKAFKGETICFDYQNYYGTRYDLSGLKISRITSRDVKQYEKMGLNGLISCEFYRNAFPHAFSSYAMARSLFDENFDYDKEIKEYFSGLFGEKAQVFYSYLTLVKDALPLEFYQYFGETSQVKEVCALNLQKIAALQNKTDVLSAEFSDWQPSNDCTVQSKMVCLAYFKTISAAATIFKMKVGGAEQKEMLNIREELKTYLSKNEEKLLPYVSIDHILQALYWVCVKKI